MNKPTFKPCDLVIFGAWGDLSKRKLLVSLFRLEMNAMDQSLKALPLLHDLVHLLQLALKDLR
jgi:hypothetical protein